MPDGSSSPARSTVRLADKGSAVSRSSVVTQAVLADGPEGEVRIWAPAVDELPDVFILKSTGASSKDEAAYWSEKAVNSEDTEVRPDGTWAVVFSAEDHEGSADAAGLLESHMHYTLIHRPAGSKQGERVVFEGHGPRQVFHRRSDTDEIAAGMRGNEEKRGFMWNFVATQFFLSDTVYLPGSHLRELGLLNDAHLYKPDALAYEKDTLYLKPSTRSQVPKARRESAWLAGTAPPEAEKGTNKTPEAEESDRAPIKELETWLYLVADRPTEAGRIEQLQAGVWQADTKGRYRYAVYPSNKDEASIEVRPEPVGPSTPYLLIDVGLISKESYSTRYALRAYVSYFPLPIERYARLGRPRDLVHTTLKEPLTPLEYGDEVFNLNGAGAARVMAQSPWPTSPFDVEEPGNHAVFEKGVWKWYVPDPLRVTLGLTQQLSKEAKRLETWQKASSEAMLNAGLVASACYKESHRRDYLQRALALAIYNTSQTLGPDDEGFKQGGLGPGIKIKTVTRYNMRSEWEGFTANQVDASAGRALSHLPGSESIDEFESESILRHFLFGYRQQHAYLRHRVGVAGARLEGWLGWPSVEAIERDLDAVETEADKDEALGTQVAAIYEQIATSRAVLAETGAGGGLFTLWLEEAGVLFKMKELPVERLDELIVPLREAEDTSWGDLLESPGFKVSWKLAKKWGKGQAKMLQAITPSLVSTLPFVEAPAAEVTIALFDEELQGALKRGGGTGNATNRRIEIDTRDPERIRVGNAIVEKRRILTYQHRSGFWNWVRRRRSTYTIRLEQNIYDATDQTKGLKRAQSLGAASVAIHAFTLIHSARQDELGPGDSIAMMKMLADAASVYDASKELDGHIARGVGRVGQRLSPDAVDFVRTTGRVFQRSARILDAATAGVKVHGALRAQRAQGAVDVRDTDEAAMAEAGLSLGGAVLIGMASTVTAPMAMVGFGLIGLGFGVAWAGDALDKEKREARDPLSKTIPKDVWGNAYRSLEYRDDLMALVRPGGDQEAIARLARHAVPKGSTLPEQTATFVETAYRFPIEVSVPEGGAPGRLALHIVPEYLPTSGTLMVAARVTPSEQGVRTADLRCVVHYEKIGKDFRYRVVPEGESFYETVEDLVDETLPSEARAGKRGADGRVEARPLQRLPRPEGDSRAKAPTIEARLLGPVGEDGRRTVSREQVPALTVFAGPWAVMPEELRGADIALANYRLAHRSVLLVTEEVLLDEVKRIHAERRAIEAEHGELAEAGAVLQVAGLEEAMAGGSFRLSGFVYFNPFQPFHPQPEVPDYDADPSNTKRMRIGSRNGFNYPADAHP